MSRLRALSPMVLSLVLAAVPALAQQSTGFGNAQDTKLPVEITAQQLSVFVQVQEVARVAIMVVDAARPLGAILLSRQLADIAHGGRIAQEGGNFVRQGLHRRFADDPMSHGAPGQCLGGS